MEIQAALEAVTALDGPLEIVSDSTYVVNCFRDRWWQGWLARGWRNSQKKPVANRDLWEPLIAAYRADSRTAAIPVGQGPQRRPHERPGRPARRRRRHHPAGPRRRGPADGPGAARPSGPPRVTAARVGVDTGGTFTDVVTDTGQVVKLDSVPRDPAQPVAAGVAQVGGARVLAHGTTVATNALLERAGGRVALISTEGQRDVIEIARQVRPSLYDLWADRPDPLVARHLRFEVAGRLDATGQEVAPLGPVPAIPAGRGRGGRLPAPRRPQPGPRAGGGRRRLAGRNRGVLERGLPRVPRVRADGDHRRRRLSAPALPGLPGPAFGAWPARCW